MEVLPNTWPFLWSSAWSSGLHGVKVNVRGCCSSQAHAYSSVASSVSSAPLLPHPQSSQHDVTPGILWQNATTPQPELLGSCLAPTVSILCVNGLVQALSTTTQSVLGRFSGGSLSLRWDPVALA